jgi:hypothetical protein
MSGSLKTGKMKELWPDAKEFRIEVIESVMPPSGYVLIQIQYAKL